MSDLDEVELEEPDIQVDPLYHFQPIIDQNALKLTNATRKFNNRTAMAKELDEEALAMVIEIPNYSRYITSGQGKNPNFHSMINGMEILFRKKVEDAIRSSITDDIAMATAEKEKAYTNFSTAIKALWADKCSGPVEDKTRDEHFSHALQALDAKAKQILQAQTSHKRPRDPTHGSPVGNNTKRTNSNKSPASDTNSGGGSGIADTSQVSNHHTGNNSPSINNSGGEGKGKGNGSTGGGNNQHLASAIQAGIRAYAAEQAAKNGHNGSRPNNSSGNRNTDNGQVNGHHRNSGRGYGNNPRYISGKDGKDGRGSQRR